MEESKMFERKDHGLMFFRGTTNPRDWIIATYAPRHSLTWLWLLGLNWDGKWHRPTFHAGRYNTGLLHWVLVLPLITLRWSAQKPMWYVDLYRQERDDRDQAAYQRHLRAAAKRQPVGPADDFPTIGSA